MKETVNFLIICVLFALLLTGCQPVVKENSESIAKLQKAEDYTTDSYNYNEADYPVDITNLNSASDLETQTYTKPPKRVVAVWQNSIETLIALGVGDRIVAAMGLPDKKYLRPEYQEQYEKIPYTTFNSLDMETVTMLEPDLILGWYSTFEAKELRSTDYWHKRDVHTYIATSSAPLQNSKGDFIFNRPMHTLDEEYDYILDLGKIFDRNEKAEELVSQMKGTINAVTEKTKDLHKRPRGLIIEFMGERQVNVYGEKSLAGNILENLNGELLAKDTQQLSMEQIVDLDPDAIFIIIIESNYGREQKFLDRIYENKAISQLRCVKEHRVYTLPLFTVYSSGVRTSDGIDIIAKGLYPDLKIDEP